MQATHTCPNASGRGAAVGFLQNSSKRSHQVSFKEKFFGKTKKHLSPNDTLPLWSFSGKFHC